MDGHGSAGTTESQDVVGLRVAVLGPGGVGGLLGGLLARGGARVVCLAGAQTVAALRERPLSVRSQRFGDFTLPVRAAERLDEPVDLCLVTVKATQLDAALDRVPPEVLDGALMVPLLNGVEHMAVLRARYPGACVIAATIRVESTRVGPGEVLHESPFASVVLAADNGAVVARVQRVADVLKRVGVEVAGNESAVLWAKLGFWLHWLCSPRTRRPLQAWSASNAAATSWALSARSLRWPGPRGPWVTRMACWRSSTRSRPACVRRCSETRPQDRTPNSWRLLGVRSCARRAVTSCQCP